jgi:hypothetical protein
MVFGVINKNTKYYNLSVSQMCFDEYAFAAILWMSCLNLLLSHLRSRAARQSRTQLLKLCDRSFSVNAGPMREARSDTGRWDLLFSRDFVICPAVACHDTMYPMPKD